MAAESKGNSKYIPNLLLHADDHKTYKRMRQGLNHSNIVKLHSFFENVQNIYIVLELCKKLSMNELRMRQKSITEFETRYYICQIIQCAKYLHDNHIIHRDLKLGNLFLNDMLHVKIGDFVLATRIEYDGERKKALCVTPNYIAPEILTKKGHAIEVDIWSIGCVMYAFVPDDAPRINFNDTIEDPYQRKPVTEINGLRDDIRLESTLVKNYLHDGITTSAQMYRHNDGYQGDENTDPAAQSLFWILKWAYQLCDERIGCSMTPQS
ncbi:GH17769 [Drosophila grimshawi]|uniref:GH17769 n=1 Tax=Drosophila grimshawi TaxID=7222 RepID=B4JXM7_DROGR|nr:GH17769 [Drosophila grimshawi]